MLTELKSNQTGYGLLVEQDAGYISPSEENIKALRESVENKSGILELYAILQKAGVKNRNGRIYPKAILDREYKKYLELIKKNLSLSELNHPESSLIDLERTAHLITEMWWEGDVLMGKLVILTSPGFEKMGIVSTKGDIAANLMRYKIILGISSRGVGSLKNINGQNIVQDDFELICFDMVSTPSTPGAYIFKDMNDKSKYNETLPEKKETNENSRSLNLMNRLNSYLGK